ncbi:MAG: hypothetical protein AMJ54_09420 [Deltaproteobacteria bacterium SG8_13]|nr:MAG: hypothetical protein AMJ54_09420 [Deltaproteobacteria bacterium SG8_13]
MIRYFLGRDLADRLHVPLARWKRWAREFLPPDPLGGLQSGYARHYSIDEAFTVYLAGHLVSRSRFSIPESRQILSDLDHWLAGEGYRAGTATDSPGENGDTEAVHEHLVLIERRPSDSGLSPGFGYTIRGILARQLHNRPGRQIEEEQYRTIRLQSGTEDGTHPQPLEQWLIWITRILQHFVECLELNPHLFAALRQRSKFP